MSDGGRRPSETVRYPDEPDIAATQFARLRLAHPVHSVTAMRTWATAGWWWWWLSAMTAAIGCGEPDLRVCPTVARSRPIETAPAYRGFLWACDHQPICPEPIACAPPAWRRLDDAQLEAVTACVLGPCELRSECVATVIADCRSESGTP
jgi:hypothetical protein